MDILSEPYVSRLRIGKSETTRVVVWSSASLDRCGPLDRAQIVEALNALGLSSLDSLNGAQLESSGPAGALLEEMLYAYDFGAIVSCTLPVSAYSLESLNLIPISALCLSTRPEKCLGDAGFTKIGQLPLRRIEALLNLLNLGKISLLEIYRKINATLIGQVGKSHSDIVRVPLGALIQIGEWDPLEHIADLVGSHDRLIGELAMLQVRNNALDLDSQEGSVSGCNVN